MGLRRLQIVVVVILAVAGVAASLVIQRRTEAKLREQREVLNLQDQRLAEVSAEHERLSDRVAEVKSFPPEGPMRELERLRVEADRMREQTNELGSRLAQSSTSRKLLGAPLSPPGYTYTPEENARREEIAAGKKQDAENLHSAFWDYYRKHQEQFPSSLDQLRPYLEEQHRTPTGTNEFEMIYAGPQDGLTNFPTQMLAVLRERQPWRAPSGRWARVYGMLTVPPRIVETEDDFQSWEAEHVIAPRTAGQK
jgi:type II secretory pathway pseudopilin PulG